MSVRAETLRFLTEEESVEVLRIDHGRYGGPYNPKVTGNGDIDPEWIGRFDRLRKALTHAWQEHDQPSRLTDFPQVGGKGGWLSGFKDMSQLKRWFKAFWGYSDWNDYTSKDPGYGVGHIKNFPKLLYDLGFGLAVYRVPKTAVHFSDKQALFRRDAAQLIRRIPLPLDIMESLLTETPVADMFSGEVHAPIFLSQVLTFRGQRLTRYEIIRILKGEGYSDTQIYGMLDRLEMLQPPTQQGTKIS